MSDLEMVLPIHSTDEARVLIEALKKSRAQLVCGGDMALAIGSKAMATDCGRDIDTIDTFVGRLDEELDKALARMNNRPVSEWWRVDGK